MFVVLVRDVLVWSCMRLHVCYAHAYMCFVCACVVFTYTCFYCCVICLLLWFVAFLEAMLVEAMLSILRYEAVCCLRLLLRHKVIHDCCIAILLFEATLFCFVEA